MAWAGPAASVFPARSPSSSREKIGWVGSRTVLYSTYLTVSGVYIALLLGTF